MCIIFYLFCYTTRPLQCTWEVAIPKSGNEYGVFTDLYSDLKIKLSFNSTRAAVQDTPVTMPTLKRAEGRTLHEAQ
jgi:hypothetical protein